MQIESTARSLLLNQSYEPMKIISWQKALILWFQDKVEVLEYHSAFARSASAAFQLPSVMRLKRFIRPRLVGHVRFCRENVYLRDDYTCQYCGVRFPERELTLDHVIPASKAGPKNWTNVVCACRDCNQRKANKTPAAARMPLRREPRIPTWLPSPELDTKRNRFPENWHVYLKTPKTA